MLPNEMSKWSWSYNPWRFHINMCSLCYSITDGYNGGAIRVCISSCKQNGWSFFREKQCLESFIFQSAEEMLVIKSKMQIKCHFRIYKTTELRLFPLAHYLCRRVGEWWAWPCLCKSPLCSSGSGGLRCCGGSSCRHLRSSSPTAYTAPCWIDSDAHVGCSCTLQREEGSSCHAWKCISRLWEEWNIIFRKIPCSLNIRLYGTGKYIILCIL